MFRLIVSPLPGSVHQGSQWQSPEVHQSTQAPSPRHALNSPRQQNKNTSNKSAAILGFIFGFSLLSQKKRFTFTHYTHQLLYYLPCSFTDTLKCRSGESAAPLRCCHSTDSVQMTASHRSYSQAMQAPSSFMSACLLLPTEYRHRQKHPKTQGHVQNACNTVRQRKLNTVL